MVSDEQNRKRKEGHKKTTYKDNLSNIFIHVQSLIVWSCESVTDAPSAS